jgi:hypothetical protein
MGRELVEVLQVVSAMRRSRPAPKLSVALVAYLAM